MNASIHTRTHSQPQTTPAKVRVLIVEDSPVIREFLEYIIAEDPRLEVAGSVGSAEEALSFLKAASARTLDTGVTSPDVISMDIRLPGMNGFEATERIMSECPTPIVVVSASVESEDLRITMNALAAGALTVLEKPVGTTSLEYEAMASRLCTQLAIMSKVKVVRRHTPGPSPRGTHGRSSPRSSGGLLNCEGDYRVLGIAGSTGGPNALIQLLNQLGADFPLPIMLVQHITASFLEGFAHWLGAAAPFPVVIVRDREPLLPGKIYVASRDRHIRVTPRRGEDNTQNYAQADETDPVCAQRPSGTVLFESMANILGRRALGVLLTGMGEDGAAGLLELRRKGGFTIAEHESTAVVYGMPGEAVRLGAVREALPLPLIAPRILQLTAACREQA